MKRSVPIRFLFLIAVTAPAVVCEAEPLPEWVWNRSTDPAPQEFRQEFVLHDSTTTAELKITGDFVELEVLLNDQPVLSLEAFDPVAKVDLLEDGRGGENQLCIIATPVDGPSAVAATVTIESGGDSITIGSGSWTDGGIESKGTVRRERWAPNHLPEVSPHAEYNQWKEALDEPSAKTLSPLPSGFILTKLRDAAEDEDSWVSLAIDPKGRIIIAQEQRGLLRFTLSDNNREIVDVERINETLEECRGLAFRGETLFANANDSKALFRLRDNDGDDQYDEVVEIQATTGSVGHGRNDLATGPDGNLHSIHGDVVDTPDRSTFFTAPEPGNPKPLGHWVSLGDGDTGWEIFARGLRNPYGIDFHRDGDPFTYDADNEGDVGLPFYRPSRINHLVRGANYGWHQRPGNTRSIPVYAPDTVPTTFDVGRGSPTGVKFGYRSNFPAKWRDAFYALDWAYGRIIAMHTVPRGASYYASGEVFLEGRPLNVTDLDFAEDGSMFFTTGGRKTKSALYRLRYDATANTAKPAKPTVQESERKIFSEISRSHRKKIEQASGPVTSDSPCWVFLGSADPWLRNAARIRLENRPVSEWRDLIFTKTGGRGRLTALLALVRQGDVEDRTFAVESASTLDSREWGRTGKLTFLRICELGFTVAVGGPATQNISRYAHDWIDSPASPVTRECARILAHIQDPKAVGRTLLLLTESATQGDRLHYLEMLSRMRTGWEEDARVSYFKSIAIARETSRGDRFMPPFFESLQREALSSAPEQKRDSLALLLEPAPPESPAPSEARKFVKNWSMTDFSDDDLAEAPQISYAEGLALFRAGQCHRCHSFGSEGYPVGPGLSTVASRFSLRDLLQSILEPSAVVSEVYRNSIVELHDGSSINGRILRDDFRQSTLYLSTNPFAPTEMTTVSKDRIKRVTESEISPMPPALLSGLTKKEIVALLHWLRSGPK